MTLEPPTKFGSPPDLQAPILATDVTYQPRRHAYQRTRDFLFAQLIPYIGSKRKLLPLIAEAIDATGVNPSRGVFADVFAGSGVVSRLAKQLGFKVIANDWEPYSATINEAIIGLNKPPVTDALFDSLNRLPPSEGFITSNFCPTDDEQPEYLTERCFYTRENGMRIDSIREHLWEMEQSGKLTPSGRDYLLAPLLSAASYVANTSGVFKAYHAGWGGATATALYRIRSELTLRPPVLLDNGRQCIVTREDAATLASAWDAYGLGSLDIAYLDPPYNQHPYGSNYHLLNTIALWDKPEVPPFTTSKSAIRADWRIDRRSAYNSSRHSLEALVELVDTLPCRWIVLSYSTDGNIDLLCLMTAFASRGHVRCFAKSYKRYRVSAQRMSPQARNVEFVLLLDRQHAAEPDQADSLFRQVTSLSSTQ